MNREERPVQNFSKCTQEIFEQTISVLRDVAFTLQVGVSAEKKAENLIFRYFENKNFSRVDPRTIVAVLLHYSIAESGEYRSQMQIASALEVNKAWIQRKRREILISCGVENYQLCTST
ncbi:MAG: cyclin family protein [Candidatus Hermodarchaeota archaeon]